MTERTTVHLLRHGEVHNPGKVLYGRLPGFRLSTAGEAMAVAAAEWFAGHDVTHLVASPLERAQQTARPLADAFGLTISQFVSLGMLVIGVTYLYILYTKLPLRSPALAREAMAMQNAK